MNDSKKPPAAMVDPALTANELAKLKDLMAALDANGITKQWTMTNAGKPFDRDLELKYFARALNGALDSDKSDLERVRHFVENRTALHQYIIKQRQITKRFTLSLAAFLLVAAAVLMLFAPEGREVLSYSIGAALVLISAGAMGFHGFWAKTTLGTLGADTVQPTSDLSRAESSLKDMYGT
jgi:hypothetical protein